MEKGSNIMQRIASDLSVIGSATLGLICHTAEVINENSALIITWGTMIYILIRAYREIDKLVEHKRKKKNGRRVSTSKNPRR